MNETKATKPVGEGNNTQLRKSKLIKTIVEISTIIFITLWAVNLWLNRANAIIEKAMWIFGCIPIFWILWPQLFKKQTNR